MRRLRRWAACVGAAALLLLAGALFVAPAALARPQSLVVATRPAPHLAPANPRFVVWQALRGLDPILESVSLHGLGERPGPQPVLKSSAPADVPERLGYAASFDLRTQGKLTPVRNQGSWGTCWSFATFGALESALMPGESLDFSEDNLVLNSGFDTGATASAKYDYGGNLEMSTAYLARWGGPVLESQDAYGDGTTPAGLSARKHVQDISWYSPRTSDTDNDRIKYALTTYGGVYVSMSWQGATSSASAYYNPTSHAYYYDGTAGTNHGVVVVGWNDDYATGNFATAPPGNGAFIVRNSWGSRWGESGCFYVSYYDTRLGRTGTVATFEGAQPSTDYGAVYQYDPLGYTAAVGYGGATAWEANKFTATEDSMLNAVAFYALSVNTAYEVYEGPSTTSLTKVAQGTVPQMGFHTVAVPAGTHLADATTFVVAVRLTSPGITAPVALEHPSSGYASPTAATGQSYISANGSTWTDVAASYANTNVCLKAYASRIPTSASAYGFAADATSSWKTSAQTVTITATGGDGANRTIHNSQDGGATWSTTAGSTADISVSTQGAHHLKYYSSDSLATEATHDAGWVNVDTVAPVTSDNHTSVPLVNPATITLTPTDATSGMTGGSARTEYKVDAAATYTTGTSVVLSAVGSHTVSYRSTDKAGNLESPDKTFTVTVTGAGPASSSTYAGFAPTATSGWFTSAPQTVTVTASGGSGTGRTIHTSQDGAATWSTTAGDTADIVVSSEGAHHIEYYASDSLATESTHDVGWVNLDWTPPVTTDDHPVTVVMGPTTITLGPSDATSGMAGGKAKTEYKVDGAAVYTAGTTVVLGEGTHTIAYRSTDAAGNVESPDKSCSVTVIDPLSPLSACGYVFAADAGSGWKNTAQTFTVTAAGGSGTGRTVHYSLDGGVTWGASAADTVDVPVTTQGSHHVEFYVSDSLAGESIHDAGWVNIDSGKPSTTATKASVRKGRKVALRFRVDDGLPGCGRAVVKLQIRKRTRVVKTIALGTRPANAALTYRYTAKLKKGTYTYRILATDIAGNGASRMVSARLRIR
jgi:C1A family cysteine protease